ncbi:MAG: Uncharacterised protein [Prochlorococcus marinus str. MIT 9215]|nr:MAG: Uncharacterised protein [Prochlorococcus marinus str. MIT 9215]
MIQQEGPGWRLSRDPSRQAFPVLIGGEHWAIELTEIEWQCLASLICDLTKQHQQLFSQLMEDEAVCLEMERQSWWACIDGDKQAWTLQVVLQGDGEQRRGAEGHWSIPAAQAMAAAMRTAWDSCQ